MSADPDTKNCVGIKIVSPRQGHLGKMCQHLAVMATCRRHVGNFISQVLVSGSIFPPFSALLVPCIISNRRELIPGLGWSLTSMDSFSGGWAGDTIVASSFSGCSSSLCRLRASSSIFLKRSHSFFLATCLRHCCSILCVSANAAACSSLSWHAFSAVVW